MTRDVCCYCGSTENQDLYYSKDSRATICFDCWELCKKDLRRINGGDMGFESHVMVGEIFWSMTVGVNRKL